MTLRLIGNYIRPADLGYNGAKNADQWLNVLRVKTPLGGVYICGDSSSQIRVALQVIHPTTGEASEVELEYPRYLYPHTVFGRTLELKEYLDYQNRRSERHLDVSKIPPKYARRNGIWGEWTAEQILDGDSPISAKSIADAEDRVRELGIKLYIFLGYSTEQWDEYNDTHLGLRKGMRLLRGGLQLATKNMPQGDTITIPMTNNIGFQNIAHVVVHFENAEPDLGRKGFQPEDVEIAERLSVSAVTAFRRYFNQLLRQRTGAPAFQQQILLSEWKAHQRRHEEENPLVIKGRGLFMPTEELPIRSFPLVEQDVVALFNQMLSSGIVRGIQIVSSSQYNQYDGLYRVWMEPPFDKYILSDDNPLGVDSSYFHDISEVVGSLDHLEILEYKFNIDALIEEFRTEEKNPDEVGLLVAWQMGTRWKESFEVISYLDPDNTHLRHAHGLTHCFHHASTGTRTFGAIILYDLVHYLLHPEEEIERQRRIYCEDEDDFL